MIGLSILIFVILCIVIVKAFNSNNYNYENDYESNYEKNNETKNKKKNINIFKFILFCIPVFFAIWMVVCFVSMIIISNFASYDSGAWAYGIIFGFFVSIILTPIVVYKTMK